MKIGIYGLTHIGLVWAHTLIRKGFDVVCYDPDTTVMAQLASGMLPVYEPDMKPKRFKQRLVGWEAMASVDLLYVTLDIGYDEEAGHSEKDLLELESRLRQASCDTKVPIVVLSQTPPGWMAARAGFRVFNQLDMLVFGKSLSRLYRPSQIVIGSHPCDKEHGVLLAFMEKAYPECRNMRWADFTTVEFAKLAINCLLASSITMTNILAIACGPYGVDWEDVMPILAREGRLGSYMKPGLGIAGGHMERDLQAIAYGSNWSRVNDFLDVIRRTNRDCHNWPATQLKELRGNMPSTVAVWGLAYKSGTDSIIHSPALALMASSAEWQFQVHDPVAQMPLVNLNAKQLAYREATLVGADALVITTPWPEYTETSIERIKEKMKGNIILDPHRMLDKQACEAAGLIYKGLGHA